MTVNVATDSIALLGVIPSLKRPARFIRDTFFAPNVVRFDTRKIAFDRIIEDQRVAPFVSPIVAGRVRAERGFTTLYYEAPYVKEKSEIRIEDLFDRGPGEAFGGDRSPVQRRDDAITMLQAQHEDRITRREELMCIELLRTGKLTVTGEGYDSALIDYQRLSTQTIALTSTARWSVSGVDSVANLKAWARATQRAPYGGVVTTVVMDPLAVELFEARLIANGQKDQLNTELRGTTASLNLGGEAVQSYYYGQLAGLNIWVYQDQVENDAGQIVNVMPDYTVLGISPSAVPTMAYGAVRVAGVLQPLMRYPRIVGGPNMDPSTEHLVTESSPLPMLRRVNATFCATVN